MKNYLRYIFSHAKRINRPLILDGAIGSLLQHRGFASDDSSWTSLANIKNPEEIIRIHKEYILAGADIITTNTFRTNPVALKDSEHSSDELVRAGINMAKKAIDGSDILIAGSNAPAEDCYQAERIVELSELKKNHEEHISLLHSYGCDFILNETQSHLDEIEIICNYCSDNQVSFILSLFFTDEEKLLSGESLFDMVKFVSQFNPLAIGFNCIMPDLFLKVVHKIPNDINWGFYLNCGTGDYKDKNISCGVDEYEYLEIVKQILPFKPAFVGSCCGSNPHHTLQLSNYITSRDIK